MIATEAQPGASDAATIKSWRDYFRRFNIPFAKSKEAATLPQSQGSSAPTMVHEADNASRSSMSYLEPGSCDTKGWTKTKSNVCRRILKTLFCLVFVAASFCFANFIVDVVIHPGEDSSTNGSVQKRQIYSYGSHPSVTPFLPTTGEETTTVVDHLTFMSTVNVTVPVTVPVTVTALATVNATETAVVGNYTTATSTSTGISSTIVTATGVQTHTTESSARPTSTGWYFGNGTTSSLFVNSISSAQSIDTAISLTVVNATITVSPMPVLSTGATAAMTASVTTLDCHTTVDNTTTTTSTTRPTFYQTVFETLTPSDNCTMGASKTASPVVSTTSGVVAATGSMFVTSNPTTRTVTTSVSYSTSTSASSSTSTSTSTSTSSDTYTSTETETTTPIVTVEKTTSVTESKDTTSVLTLTGSNTVTVTLSKVSTTTQTESSTGVPASSTAVCGVKETETVSIIIISTVFTDSHSTTAFTSTLPGTTTLFPHSTTETVSTSGNMTGAYTINGARTSNSTSLATTPGIKTTGSVDGITASAPSSSKPCNATSTHTVTVAPEASSTADNIGVVVSTMVSTMVTTFTTGTLHSHTVSDISIASNASSTPASASATATPTLHPFTGTNGTANGTTTTAGTNGTYGTYSYNATSKPETLPLGPASPDGVVPLGWNVSGSGVHPHPSSSASETSSAAAAQAKPLWGRDATGSRYDDMTCVVMLSAVVAFVLVI